MRKVGAFEEIRSVLSLGVGELSEANPSNFFRSSDKIVENIRDAFEKHMAEVKTLRTKKIKFAGYDIGTMLAAGAIDIASIATGTPTFGAASFAVNQIVDAPKLREIPSRFRALKDAHKELKRSPMGLLFQHKAK
jgi:predicted homoserine dehydrogenase-like protein